MATRRVRSMVVPDTSYRAALGHGRFSGQDYRHPYRTFSSPQLELEFSGSGQSRYREALGLYYPPRVPNAGYWRMPWLGPHYPIAKVSGEYRITSGPFGGIASQFSPAVKDLATDTWSGGPLQPDCPPLVVDCSTMAAWSAELGGFPPPTITTATGRYSFAESSSYIVLPMGANTPGDDPFSAYGFWSSSSGTDHLTIRSIHQPRDRNNALIHGALPFVARWPWTVGSHAASNTMFTAKVRMVANGTYAYLGTSPLAGFWMSVFDYLNIYFYPLHPSSPASGSFSATVEHTAVQTCPHLAAVYISGCGPHTCTVTSCSRVAA